MARRHHALLARLEALEGGETTVLTLVQEMVTFWRWRTLPSWPATFA